MELIATNTVRSAQKFSFSYSGATSILHDSESPMNINHCADLGCYSRPIIRYNATEKQMNAHVLLLSTFV